MLIWHVLTNFYHSSDTACRRMCGHPSDPSNGHGHTMVINLFGGYVHAVVFLPGVV